MFLKMFWLPVLAVLIHSAYCCDPTALSKCTAIVPQLNITKPSSFDKPTLISEEQATKICNSVLPQVKECAKQAACGNNAQAAVVSSIYGNLLALYQYICVEGHDDIMQFRSCISRSEVQAGISRCTDDVMASVMSGNLGPAGVMGPTELQNRMCSMYTSGIHCPADAVRATCGDRAACVMYNMIEIPLRNILQTSNCTSTATCQDYKNSLKAGSSSGKILYDFSTLCMLLLLTTLVRL